MPVRRFKWWIVPVAIVGILMWLELFLLWPLQAVVLLLALLGWGDYLRRRARLKPPDD
jgi:hypothetical protein